MLKIKTMAVLAVASVLAPIAAAAPAAAQTVYNADPTQPYINGTGGAYTPANFAVSTFNGGDQIALRYHISRLGAPASDNAGNYSFAAGVPGLSYEFSIDDTAQLLNHTSALLTLTDLGTGQVVSFNPYGIPDNTVLTHQPGGQGFIQNSEKLSFAIVGFGPLFDASKNDTYRTTFSINDATGAAHSLSINAIVGSGFTAAVPETATWGMMILGMGAIGVAMRRRKVTTRVSYAA